MSTQKVSPTFRRLLTGANGGEVLKPIIEAYLWDPKFPSFSIDIEGWKPKPPDGYFHPSTHPLMSERQLYYYLAEPHNLLHEVFDPTSTMTVTQGHFWHEFVQMVGLNAGFLLPSPHPTKGRNIAEWGFTDADTMSRGHCDGVTNDLVCGTNEVFEFKSMRSPRADKIAKGRPDSPEVQASFKALAPTYYAQAQEYMRISGYRRWRGVILSIEWPFPMREIVLDYDPFYAQGIRDKYRSVLQAVADQRPPGMCCSGGKAAKDCFARATCPMGLL